MTVTIVDWRGHEPDPPPKLTRDGKRRYNAARDGRVIKRDSSKITGICIHQTACIFGPLANPAKRHERALSIPVHAVAFRDGFGAITYPPLWHLHAANAWNATTVSLEIEGHYGGLARTRGDFDELDELTIETAKQTLEALYVHARGAGCPIKYIVAHRQSSATRRSDPGEAIWRAVVLDHAVAKLGLQTRPHAVVGDGRPIPLSWDPAGKGPL